jgi:hypothetical protein
VRQNAVLYSQSSPRNGRTTVSVVAEDISMQQLQEASDVCSSSLLDTGYLVRCEVFLDRISSIGIVTTTRTMYRENVEAIEIQAYDEEGTPQAPAGEFRHTLTVLCRKRLFDGLRSRLRVEHRPEPPAGGQQYDLLFVTSLGWFCVDGVPPGVLKFVSYKDSGVETSRVVEEMEADKRDTSTKLVQGIEVGKATVAVRLAEAELFAVAGASVQITVLEPLELRPSSPVYLAVGAALPYSLMTFRRGAYTAIAMPNPQYLWMTENRTVASVESSGVVHALQLGSTVMRVQAANLTDNEVDFALCYRDLYMWCCFVSFYCSLAMLLSVCS